MSYARIFARKSARVNAAMSSGTISVHKTSAEFSRYVGQLIAIWELNEPRLGEADVRRSPQAKGRQFS
jgi:hypothetical protein